MHYPQTGYACFCVGESRNFSIHFDRTKVGPGTSQTTAHTGIPESPGGLRMQTFSNRTFVFLLSPQVMPLLLVSWSTEMDCHHAGLCPAYGHGSQAKRLALFLQGPLDFRSQPGQLCAGHWRISGPCSDVLPFPARLPGQMLPFLSLPLVCQWATFTMQTPLGS